MSATGDVRSEDGSAGTLAQTPDLAAATEVALEPAEGVSYQTTYSAIAKEMGEEMTPRGLIRPTQSRHLACDFCGSHFGVSWVVGPTG